MEDDKSRNYRRRRLYGLPLDEVDVIFFCFGHGKSEEFLKEHAIPAHVKIIDLAQDFRLAAPGNDYVYGLPELNKEAIQSAQHVANPGCFATCIQLGLLPLAANGWLKGDIAVNAITGSTGAGVKPGATTHFSWRNNNMSIYKAFNHQHVPEIRQSLKQLQPDFDGAVDFIPYRGDFARGIFATLVVRMQEGMTAEAVVEAYRDYYKDAAFTHYVEKGIDMKQVVNTNKALVHQGSQRTGCAEYESDVRTGRNCRTETQTFSLLRTSPSIIGDFSRHH